MNSVTQPRVSVLIVIIKLSGFSDRMKCYSIQRVADIMTAEQIVVYSLCYTLVHSEVKLTH